MLHGLRLCSIAMALAILQSGANRDTHVVTAAANSQSVSSASVFGPTDLATEWAKLPFDSISLERSPCNGNCPAYTVRLYRGTPVPGAAETYEDRFGRAELSVTRLGEVDFAKLLFPPKTGEFKGRVSLWEFARLSALIGESGFLQITQDTCITQDGQTVWVTVNGSGVEKRVRDACGIAPVQVWGIQQAIDAVAARINWTVK